MTVDLAFLSGFTTISAEEYHSDPCERPSLSSSIAHLLCTQSPAHARNAHPRLNPDFQREEKDTYDLGTVAHALLLEGEAGVVVVEASDWRTKDAQEAKKAARAAGQVPLLAKDWTRAEQMVAAARRQLEMFDLDPPAFTDGKSEQTLVWEEPGGVLCRARFDWLHNDLSAIDDYKTTSRSAEIHSWGKTLFGIGSDIQVAFYLRGLRKALGSDAVWRYVVQENYPPYAVSVAKLGESVMGLANAKVEHAINVWRKCLQENNWPSYSRQVGVVELPAWADREWTEGGDA